MLYRRRWLAQSVGSELRECERATQPEAYKPQSYETRLPLKWADRRPRRALPASSQQKRHDGKNPQHHDINRSRYGVAAGEVLANGEAPNPEYDREFRAKQEAKRDETDAKPCSRCGWQGEQPSHPPRREHGNHKHYGRLHQFGCPRTETRDYPKYADGPKHEAGSKHESEVEHASFQNLHDSLMPLHAPGVAPAEDFTVQPNSCLGGKLCTTFSAPGDTDELLPRAACINRGN